MAGYWAKLICIAALLVTINARLTQPDGCECAGGKISVFGYETVPEVSGVGCIGGCGGEPFEFHANSSTVKQIDVWAKCGASGGLRGLRVTLFNGQQKMVGQSACTELDTFTFKPGEYLTGNLILSGNGIGTRTGYIEFSTSAGRTFKSGEDGHTKYVFPVESGYLTGFFGQAGDDIDQLGFLVIKPISYVRLSHMSYPTLDGLTTGLNPKALGRFNLCNDESIAETITETIQRTEGSNSCWETSATFSFSSTTTVEAGIPEIIKVSETFKWGVSATASYKSCSEESKTTTLTVPVTVPARSTTVATFTQFASAIDVPYKATLTLYLKDNSHYSFNADGTYKGLFVTSVDASYDGAKLKKGEKCPTEIHVE